MPKISNGTDGFFGLLANASPMIAMPGIMKRQATSPSMRMARKTRANARQRRLIRQSHASPPTLCPRRRIRRPGPLRAVRPTRQATASPAAALACTRSRGDLQQDKRREPGGVITTSEHADHCGSP